MAFPTETVYGLGALATDPAAVARIYAAKGRPPDHPLIVHLAATDELDRWAAEVPESAARLAAALWPGPLTIVLRRAPRLPSAATGGRDTVGLRVPDHPAATRLLELVGGPVAAPSANRFGRVSPTTAADVVADLGSAVDLVVDGGACRVGLESTIVELVDGAATLLRPGGVPAELIEAVLGMPLRTGEVGPARASGMPPSHYAPGCRVELVTVERVDRSGVRPGRRRCPGGGPGDGPDPAVGRRRQGLVVLPAGGHGRGVRPHALPAAPRRRTRPAQRCSWPCRQPPEGLGLAVADRLRRAAAPRPSSWHAARTSARRPPTAAAGGVALHAPGVGRRPAARAGPRRRARGSPPTSGPRTRRARPPRRGPRASRSATTSSPKRDSIVSRAGSAWRGQNDDGMWSLWKAGLSMASCRFAPVVHDPQEERQLPLVLAVAAGRAERHPAARRRGGRSRGSAWCGGACRAARLQGWASSSQNICAPGAEREAQLGHDRRGLQPAARRRGRDHVAPAVGHVEVAGVARRHRRRRAGAVADGPDRPSSPAAERGARLGGAPPPQQLARAQAAA